MFVQIVWKDVLEQLFTAIFSPEVPDGVLVHTDSVSIHRDRDFNKILGILYYKVMINVSSIATVMEIMHYCPSKTWIMNLYSVPPPPPLF
jgi:hypothetical protein